MSIEWKNPELTIPMDHEVIAFWVTRPKRTLLLGEFQRKDPLEDSIYVSFIDWNYFQGSKIFKADSGLVTHWCSLDDPLKQLNYMRQTSQHYAKLMKRLNELEKNGGRDGKSSSN